MKKINKKYNYKRTIPKMAGGGIPSWGENGQANAQAIAGFAGMMSPLLGEGSRGAGALSGASTGASMGAALGPIGMGVGAVLGGTLGLIGAGKQKREEEKFAKEQAIATSKAYGNQFNSQLDTNNQNAYGSAQRFADGGDTPKKKNKIIYTDNKNDPRLKSYNDSLNLYNSSKKLYDYEKYSIENASKKVAKEYGNNKLSTLVKVGNESFKNSKANNLYYEEINKNILGHNSKIKPISYDNYLMTSVSDKIGSEGLVKSFDKSKMPTTDIPIYKKPNQPIAYKAYNRELIQPVNILPLSMNPLQPNIVKQDLKQSLLRDNKYSLGRGSQRADYIENDVIDYVRNNPSLYPGKSDLNYNQLLQELQSNQDFSTSVQSGLQSTGKTPLSMNYPDQFKYTPKMANGGIVEPNIINIEKGELQIDPSTGKILREYTGINPETGGLYEAHKKKGKDVKHNIVSAEEDTFIITKKEAPNYKKAIDNNDKLHLESIKMNIRNNKDAKMGTYKMGSFVKYGDGDKVGRNPFTSKQDLINFQNAQGLNPDGLWGKNSSSSYYNPIQTNPINQINMPANNFQVGSPLGTSSVNTGMASSYNPNLGKGFGNVANNLLQYAPSIANIGQGLFGKVETNSKVQAQVNPFQNQVLNNMPQEVSAQPIIDELQSNIRGQYRNIDNKTSSSAIARANKNNIFGNYQNRLADIRMNVAQANNGIKTQKGSIYNNLGQQQVANNLQAENTNFNIDQINSQNKAAKTNMLNTGFSQLQQTYMNNQKNDQLYNTDMYKAKLLGEMFPNSKFYNDLFGSETLSKLGRRG